ncbi:unnamed protein product [Protopolystoma xenopodis]|uniref:Uncharacterized protein n=1 Tax=Protopolystoma xenopodis TaxID=117903 RepID=A0A448XCV4_9PLAT|nr:unnamed protein product [Protopolystoma xenopodis]
MTSRAVGPTSLAGSLDVQFFRTPSGLNCLFLCHANVCYSGQVYHVFLHWFLCLSTTSSDRKGTKNSYISPARQLSVGTAQTDPANPTQPNRSLFSIFLC